MSGPDNLNPQQAKARKELSNRARYQASSRRREVFLDLLANGRNIVQACDEIGITRSAYHQWRQRFPDFRARADEIRMGGALQELDVAYEGDFMSFRKKFFGLDTYWHQREIVRAIETAKGGDVVLVLVAPETGKTTVLEDYMCKRLGEDPDLRITYVSEGQIRTRKIARRLQKRMSDTGLFGEYIARFGPFYVPGQEKRGKPWTSDYFSVYKADHDERDYSFEGRGWRSTVAGTRTDLLLIDDVQSRRSINQTADIVETLRQDFFSRPGRDGVVVIVGTRVDQGDVYEALQELGIVTKVISLPMMNADGKSLCPEMWPEDALARKRQLVGESAWWRNYMQAPRAAMDSTFDDEAMERGLHPNLRLGERLGDSSRVIAMLDPALTGGNGLVVANYDAEKFRILDVRFDVNIARTEAILARIQDLAQRYRFEELIVEVNAFQRGFATDARLDAMSREFGFKVIAHETGRNKNDSDLGIARMPASMRAGEIEIPWGDEATRTQLAPLVEQLRNWRADISPKRRRQDLPMAMWFGWLYWQERRATLARGSGTFVRRRMPYSPTSTMLLSPRRLVTR